MYMAYLFGAYTMAEIAKFFGVHYMRVSRAVRQFEKQYWNVRTDPINFTQR
jgi:transposase